MTTYGLLAFAVMAVFFVLVPSPLFRLSADVTLQRGRRSAVATVPGLGFGLCGAAALAALPVMLCARQWPELLGVIAFAGPWYLFAYICCSFLDPRRRRASAAANDNLPERRALRIFALLVKQGTLSPRHVLAMLAVLIQVWEPGLPALPQFLAMEVTCAIAMAAAAGIQAIVPRRLFGRAAPLPQAKTASRKARTVFIARRAVTAGYRRIAA